MYNVSILFLDGEKMEDILKQILSEVQSVKTEVQSVKTEIQSVKTEIQSMKSEIQLIKSDISELKEGQQKLEVGQQEIKNELTYIWGDIKKLDSRLSNQEQETFMLKRVK